MKDAMSHKWAEYRDAKKLAECKPSQLSEMHEYVCKNINLERSGDDYGLAFEAGLNVFRYSRKKFGNDLPAWTAIAVWFLAEFGCIGEIDDVDIEEFSPESRIGELLRGFSDGARNTYRSIE